MTQDTRDKLARLMDELYSDHTVIARLPCGCIRGAAIVPKSTNTSGMRSHLQDIARWRKDKEVRLETVNHKDMPVTLGGRCDACRPPSTLV